MISINERKKIFYIAVRILFVVGMLLSFGLLLNGCGEKKQEATTEKPEIDEDTLTDSDGFRIVKDYVETTQDGVKIRREPKEDADVYITLDKGVNLSRTGVKDEWTRLLINGSSFYVQSKYLEETIIKWASENDSDKVSHVVFIDPAKQITEDTTMEPVSPDIENDSAGLEYASLTSAQQVGMKKKMTAAGVGVNTGVFEYDITMTVAKYLNSELVKRGYTVYISRSTNNVNISNAKRAQMANAVNAEVYIKLEAATSRDEAASGELGFITTSLNSHNGSLYQNNYELCYDLLKTTCERTEAKRMGIYETDDLTSLNYCNMPATVLNIGFLSNELDEISLTSEDYQKQLAVGIAEGIDLYFEEIDKNK
ncbi:MAG: N-acetylmuramoyl-L-alanine amidase [Eubacterium sp.]|nr:N-acetylmuramoyl-L-alanine amidase [Eubacterium sp.]